MPPLVVVMGVAGSGKTSVGRRVAEALQVPFLEGDDLHDATSIAKMRRGEPLSERDREPWLHRLHHELSRHVGTGAVLACSALTESFRWALVEGLGNVRFLYLRGDEGLLRSRLSTRTGHFAGPDLLPSQLQTLEPPADALVVDIDGPPEVVVARALAALLGERGAEG